MFSTIPALTLAKKAVAATVVCGAVALGTGGAAFAATPTTAVAGHHHARCSRAGKALTKIDKVETGINARLSKLNAAETKASGAGHTKLAARIEKRITRLQTADAKAGVLASKIQAKCPGVVAS